MRWAWTPSPGPARRARCCGPRESRETAARLLDALHDNTLIHRNVVLNGLSAGAYSVGNTLLELDARGGRDAFYDRIQSAVYDCPVDFDGVPKGVSSAMLGEGTPLQKLGESAIRLYLKAVDTEKVGELERPCSTRCRPRRRRSGSTR